MKYKKTSKQAVHSTINVQAKYLRKLHYYWKFQDLSKFTKQQENHLEYHTSPPFTVLPTARTWTFLVLPAPVRPHWPRSMLQISLACFSHLWFFSLFLPVLTGWPPCQYFTFSWAVEIILHLQYHTTLSKSLSVHRRTKTPFSHCVRNIKNKQKTWGHL